MKKLIVLALIAAMIAIVSVNFVKAANEPNAVEPNVPKDVNQPKATMSIMMLAEEPNMAEPNMPQEPNVPAPK